MLPIKAFLFDGINSQKKAINVELLPDGGLSYQLEQQTFVVLAEDLNVSDRLGQGTRFIRWGKALIESAENDVIDQWLAQTGKQNNFLLHKLESHLGLVIASAVLLFVLLFVSYFVFLPRVSDYVAEQLPASMLDQASVETLQLIDSQMMEASTLSDERQDDLRAKFNQMLAFLSLDIKKYQLQFRHSNIGPNAFALPDGTVILTDELINLAEQDVEVLSVLAHEIGHVEHRHSIKQLVRSSLSGILIGFYFGDASAVSGALVALPTMLAEAQFSQQMELDADDYAYQYLTASGQPVSEFADILLRITGTEDIPEDNATDQQKSQWRKHLDDASEFGQYFLSHPPTAERLKRFR